MLRNVRAGAPAAALLLAFAMAGCGGEPSEPAPTSPTEEESPTDQPETDTPTLKVGGTAEFSSQFTGEQGTTLRVKVNSVDYRTKTTEEGASSTPDRKYFALVSLTVKNTGDTPGSFEGANFVWVSPDKERIQDAGVAGVLGVPNAEAASTTFQPGQSATGTEVFDLPQKGGQLDYEIDQGAAPLLTINLPAE